MSAITKNRPLRARDLPAGAAAISQVERARPIDTAPTNGNDYFPPRTPGDEPLNFVLLWQPAHGRWPGAWRLGFWGGPDQGGWYDDQMSLMKPQPTHWGPLLAPPACSI